MYIYARMLQRNAVERGRRGRGIHEQGLMSRKEDTVWHVKRLQGIGWRMGRRRQMNVRNGRKDEIAVEA